MIKSNASISAGLIAGAIAIGILPLYVAELNVMAHLSMYQFFPFVFLFVVGVGWMRWRQAEETIGPREGASWWPETLFVGLALLLLLAHAGLFGPWLGGAAGTVAAAAAVMALRRLRDVQLWDLWLLLLITMRMPLEMDRQLAELLQKVSSRLSSLVLDGLGVLHLLAGNVVILPQRELFVDEACSGIISVMSVIACAAMLAVWRNRPLLHMLLLIGIGVGCAMLMNVVRISTIAVALAWYDVDLTSGWPHEALSLTAFMATFLMLVGADAALVALLAKVPEGSPAVPRWKGVRSAVRAWNWASAVDVFHKSGQWAVGSGQLAAAEKVPGGVSGSNGVGVRDASPRRAPWVRFAVLGAAAIALGTYHSVALYAHYMSATSDVDHVVQRIVDLEQAKVQEALRPWQVTEATLEERDTISELGRFSKVYRVEHPATGMTATVSLDFPFYRKWHDLCGCYAGGGWLLERKTVVREGAPAEAAECQYIVGEFTRELDGHGRVVFANLNEEGALVAPPREFGDLGYLINTFIMKAQHARQVSLNPRKLFQVQVWHQQPTRHTEAQQKELDELFFRAYGLLKEKLGGSR